MLFRNEPKSAEPQASEVVRTFLTRNDQELEVTHDGPFRLQAQAIKNAFEAHSDFLVPDDLRGEPILRSNEVYFRLNGKEALVCIYQLAEQSKYDRAYFIGLDTDTATAQMDRYKLTETGILVNLDDTRGNVENQADLQASLAQAIESVEVDLQDQKYEAEAAREQKRQKRRQLGKRVVVGVIASSSFMAASYGARAGWHHWYTKPHEQAAAARADFDEKDIDLPGEGIRIQADTVQPVDAKLFATIPSAEDSDSFRSPRTITVKPSETCISLDGMDFKPNEDSIFVVSRTDSEITDNSWSAGLDDNGELDLCIRGTEDLSSETKVAIQIRKNS